MFAAVGGFAVAAAVNMKVERPHWELWVFIVNNVDGKRAGYMRAKNDTYTDELDCEVDLLSIDVPKAPVGWHYELGCLKRGPREREI